MNPLILVEVIALLEEPNQKAPVVVLHSREPNKVLPIWIGHPEARAIAVILQNIKPERPLTHDLFANTIETLNAKISKVVVDRIEGHTYFARLHLIKDHEKVEVDSRPSDAIAIALKMKVPIFVSKKLMEDAGQENPFETAMPKKELTEEELKKLHELLKEAQEREQESH